ncbi:MAG: hypothetical protein JST59_09715 [Actinobacteria bacterium]|nr:hypothetical protein [Actinomycetota bacterium]
MAEGPMREPGSDAGWQVIDAAVDAARRSIGDDLVSAYAIGSLGHGGFSAAASDVDLALLTSDSTETSPHVELIEAEVKRALPDAPLVERLSVFHVPWSHFASPPPGSRFPAIDRRDLMQSGVLVFGEDLRDEHGVEPPAEEILDHAISAALARNTPEALSGEVDALTPEAINSRTTPKLVLWPVRLLHTIDTAKAAGNEEAAAHYREATDPPPRHLPLVEASLEWRAGAIGDGVAAHTMLRQELLPLYAEIYTRLADRPDLPHAERIAARAAELAAANP